ITGGKAGAIYLMDRDDLGSYQRCGTSCDDVVQVLAEGAVRPVFDTPAYFNGSVYYHACCGDVLKAFQLINGQLSETPVSKSDIPFGYPGATPAISANGSTGGIVWTLNNADYANGRPAVLYAHDAHDLSNLLYTTGQSPADQLDGAIKFSVPTVANGKIYVGTQTSLAVFGPIGPATVTLTITGDPVISPYGIEAQTDARGDLQVNFYVDGVLFKSDSAYRYCLFGENPSCDTAQLGAGPHVIAAKVFAAGGSEPVAATEITIIEGGEAASELTLG